MLNRGDHMDVLEHHVVGTCTYGFFTYWHFNHIQFTIMKSCTDDHIFEKTLKIELSPIPQAYPLKANL
jgi:hypothetical protein